MSRVAAWLENVNGESLHKRKRKKQNKSRFPLKGKRVSNPIPVETLPMDRRMDVDQESLDMGSSVCTCLVGVKRLFFFWGGGRSVWSECLP